MVRFGVIGAGLMGREFASAAARWLHLAETLPQPQIVAVADPVDGARRWFEERVPSVRLSTPDYTELLADPGVDAVYIAVPHDLHEKVYIDAIRAGKHVMGEKPFGIDLPACERIVAEVHAHPDLLVRCSSEFPYFPGAQRIARMIEEGAFGKILEFRAAFNHSSDLDPNKPINWKRRVASCGEYGCMGDLGMHVMHMPLRAGWRPRNVRALLSKVVETRPDGKGGFAPCETWDNAILACESDAGFPMILETKRISPGDTNSWSVTVLGTENSAEFSTKNPKTLRTMPYHSGEPQTWREESLGYTPAHAGITGHIFEFGFPDAILQMWAAFVAELEGKTPPYPCAKPEEALLSHRLFTAALESQRMAQTVGF